MGCKYLEIGVIWKLKGGILVKKVVYIIIVLIIVIGGYGGYILYEGDQNTKLIIDDLNNYSSEEPSWQTDLKIYDDLHTKINTEFCFNLSDEVKERIVELSRIKGDLTYSTFGIDSYLEKKDAISANTLIAVNDKEYLTKYIDKTIQKKLFLSKDELDVFFKIYDDIKILSLTSTQLKSIIQSYSGNENSDDENIKYDDVETLLKMYNDDYWQRVEKLSLSKEELRKIIQFYQDGKIEVMEKFIVHEEMDKKKKIESSKSSSTKSAENLVLSQTLDISNIKYTGDKVNFSVTNNTSSVVTYIEFDLRVYDSNDKVIDTDWTNWSGNLRTGDSAKVDAYVTDGMSISIEVSEWLN